MAKKASYESILLVVNPAERDNDDEDAGFIQSNLERPTRVTFEKVPQMSIEEKSNSNLSITPETTDDFELFLKTVLALSKLWNVEPIFKNAISARMNSWMSWVCFLQAGIMNAMKLNHDSLKKGSVTRQNILKKQFTKTLKNFNKRFKISTKKAESSLETPTSQAELSTSTLVDTSEITPEDIQNRLKGYEPGSYGKAGANVLEQFEELKDAFSSLGETLARNANLAYDRKSWCIRLLNPFEGDIIGTDLEAKVHIMRIDLAKSFTVAIDFYQAWFEEYRNKLRGSTLQKLDTRDVLMLQTQILENEASEESPLFRIDSKWGFEANFLHHNIPGFVQIPRDFFDAGNPSKGLLCYDEEHLVRVNENFVFNRYKEIFPDPKWKSGRYVSLHVYEYLLTLKHQIKDE